MASSKQKVAHLTLIVGELCRGHDLLETPSAEGGILLGDDEDDIANMVTTITEDIVPVFYCGNWSRFLLDFVVALKNAQEDGTGDVIEDITYWLDKIMDDGKLMVA